MKIEDILNTVICGDALAVLKTLPDESVNSVITSPPYYLLRNYEIKGQIGLETTYQEYVKKLIDVFNEIKRVLKKDGTCFVNLADTFAGGGYGIDSNLKNTKQASNKGTMEGCFKIQQLRKENKQIAAKSLMMIPERFAIAMIENGFILRNKLIWCLSGGTYIYAKTQKGVAPTMIRDLARLKPSTIQLWNGKKWTNILGMSKNKRNNNEIELVLRSGERISCTPSHKFPTKRGILEAKDILKGDQLISTILPEPKNPRDCFLDEDAAWLAGLYIADGSHSKDVIQIAGHIKEIERWERLQKIAKKFGGYITRTINGNKMDIRLYGKILNAILNELVSGKTAEDKCFSSIIWDYSNNFIRAMLNGYLKGDGYWDKKNNRWRLGFIRNYNLERDLRTACARLGYRLVLNLGKVKYNGKDRPIFKGELREGIYREKKNKQEVVKIQKARCREIYDIGVEDEPHLFSLASGILTHNCKRNAMPESINDRWKKAHEYIFFFVKSNTTQFWTHSKTKERVDNKPKGINGIEGVDWEWRDCPNCNATKGETKITSEQAENFSSPRGRYHRKCNKKRCINGKIKRSLWDSHDYYFDLDAIRTPHKEVSIKRAEYEQGRNALGINPSSMGKKYLDNKRYLGMPAKMVKLNKKGACPPDFLEVNTNCSEKDGSPDHYASYPLNLIYPLIKAGSKKGDIILDPFGGSMTTCVAAKQLRRNYIAVDLNPKYIEIGKRRLVFPEPML